jgi:twitching motility two-component system response regulator PilG
MSSPNPAIQTSDQDGSLYKVLQKLILNQASGKLTIYHPQDPAVRWRLYLGNGRIHYAGSEIGQKERLQYLLRRYVPQKSFNLQQIPADDYQYLCQLWKAGEFSFQEIRSILAKFTQEALVQTLSLRQSLCQFENTVGLEHLLLYLNLKSIMTPVEQQLKQWLKLRGEIVSPFQRPILTQNDRLAEVISPFWGSDVLSADKIQILQGLLQQHLCFYELGDRLKMNTLNVALMLHPLIQTQAIQLHPYPLPQSDDRPIIACIDDSPAIQRIVTFTLENSGFRVVNIREPFKALTTLLHNKPDLILMDITMPEIDGYQLCGLCNKSAALKGIPIIMLTGRTGIIDRVKAKVVGAVDYISKPFLPQDLVATVRHYVKGNQSSNP